MTQRRIYQNEFPYFITFRTRENYPLFEDTKMTGLLANIIFNAGRLKRYDILAYQIMPDHVHLLVCQTEATAGGDTRVRRSGGRRFRPHTSRVSVPAMGSKTPPTISDLMYTIKSYFIKQIRTNHDISYSIWHTRFYTRIVSTRKYLRTVIEYIKYNPIKAGLPDKYCRPPYRYFTKLKTNNLF